MLLRVVKGIVLLSAFILLIVQCASHMNSMSLVQHQLEVLIP